ncbi:hypothetical protein ACGF5M_04200 [Gemmatimonadota bacterium]
MGRFLRRLRGIIGTGVTWAVGWAGVSAVAALLVGDLASLFEIAALFGITGFIAGCSSATVLSIQEHHKQLEDLSLLRTALWGGFGGMLAAGAFIFLTDPSLWPFVAILSLLGAGSSAGTVALARRADTKLIEGDDEQIPRLNGD